MKQWIVELADELTGDLIKVHIYAYNKEDAISGAWFELSEEGEDVNNYTLIDAYSNLHLYAISKDGKIYSGNNYEDIISNKPINFFSKDDSIKGYIDKKGKFYDEDGNIFEGGGSIHEYTDDIWSFEAKVPDVDFYYEESWVKNMLPENSQIEFVKGENFKVKYRNVIDINPEGIDGGTPYIEEVSGTVVVEYSLREDEDLEIIELDFKTDADWNLKVLKNTGCIATTIDSLEINFKNKEVEVDFAGDSKGEWDSYEEGGGISLEQEESDEYASGGGVGNKIKHKPIYKLNLKKGDEVIEIFSITEDYEDFIGVYLKEYIVSASGKSQTYMIIKGDKQNAKHRFLNADLLPPNLKEAIEYAPIYIGDVIKEQIKENKYKIKEQGDKYGFYMENIENLKNKKIKLFVNGEEHSEIIIDRKKYAKGGEVRGFSKGDIVNYEDKQYKVGSFDVLNNKTTLVYLNDLNNKPAQDSKGDYLKVNSSRIEKYAKGGGVGEIQSEITKEELESKLGRKLNGWNDDRVEYNGVTYVKCFLKPHYRIA